MIAFFSDLFGRPPEEVDGVWIWRDVDSHGVTPARLGRGALTTVDPSGLPGRRRAAAGGPGRPERGTIRR